MENTWFRGHSDRIYTGTGQGIPRIVGSLHRDFRDSVVLPTS